MPVACAWLGCGGSFGFGSLTVYMVASMMCGSIVIVTVPTFVILSFGGFFGSSLRTPFRLCGFVQYFSKRPSLVHFCRDRDSDSARTPLPKVSFCQQTTHRTMATDRSSAYLSPIDWYSFSDKSSPCASSTVGSGFPGCTDLGSGGGGGGSSAIGSGVGVGSRGVEFRRFAACSTRAAARAGSFLFFSIVTALAHDQRQR